MMLSLMFTVRPLLDRRVPVRVAPRSTLSSVRNDYQTTARMHPATLILALCFAFFASPSEACPSLNSLLELSDKFAFPHRDFLDGLSCVKSGGEVSIRLFGDGSHRQLRLGFQRKGSTVQKGGWGEFIFLQHLPPTLFVDPYQLEDLSTKLKFPSDFKVFGRVDLEAPAPASSPTLVSISIPGPLSETKSISLPIHAKYPKPKSINGGSQKGFEIVDVPPPVVILKDSNGSSYLLDQVGKSSLQNWRVPAGEMSHLSWVNLGTGGFLLVSAGIVAWAVCTMEERKGGKAE